MEFHRQKLFPVGKQEKIVPFHDKRPQDSKLNISKNQLGFLEYPTDEEIAWEINNLRE